MLSKITSILYMKIMRVMFTLLMLAVVSPCCVLGFSSYQTLIPNGGMIRDPCDGQTIWQGVGHQAMDGAGPRNPFGVDFYNNGRKWNRTMCEMDSDGDGISNGAELGDPLCVWNPGSNPTNTPTGHPGVCEPWSDPMCLQKNTFHICQTQELECDAINSPDVQEFRVTFPSTDVPAQETTYMCMNFALPADQDYHVIADKGSIDNEFVMHHILIIACETGVESYDLVNPLNTPYVCGMAGERQCQQIIAMWSVGISGVCHNENAGFRIGPTGYKYGTMQMHWNNPSLRSDYEDSSGMTLYYTPVLRPYNLGNLMIGERQFSIPPGESRHVIESECSSTCSDRIMTSSVYIITGLNHMHYMGREMTTFHTPAGGVERAIVADPHYSYDNPVIHTFQTPLEVKPGDVLSSKCSYTSSQKNKTTFSGEATSQEMCYAFLLYYPKESIKSPRCLTVMGLPSCSIDHEADVLDGCQLKSFLNNAAFFQDMFLELTQRCENFICRKECKTYIHELRQNPCLQGKVKAYVERVVSFRASVNEMALYHSCNAELALEAVGPCTCTTEPLGRCVEYTGAAVSQQTSLYLLLVAMTTIHSF
ncbi:tyramine beta-hydroxylase-like [Mizuhopecten yessoensis]|uniref:tyramine beta-hydroxylase-like n=1 Tax=Mizuhopecten yessoensis TaxID=6573 RepID=UPI000B45963C|nr:tyramine beta-hydroxylase-like [Mizuhopecten yessoensis]